MKDWMSGNNKVIVRGEGFSLIDCKGMNYVDGNASMWCNVWGHSTNEIIERMIVQLRTLPHSTLFGLGNAPSIHLAKRLVEIAPGMQKIFYSDNGSTAIEVSMKMALQYWHNKGKVLKTRFVSIDNGYHGDTVGAMSLGHVENFFHAYKPLLRSALKVPSPLSQKKGPEREKQQMEYCIDQTEKILQKYSPKICALVMESGAQIAGGVIVYPKGYQEKISKLCDRYDVLLILDEIATGFGRLGNMIEYSYQKSNPDIVCFGKALTAGYFPLAVTAATQEIFEPFLGEYFDNNQLHHGHTFTGNPVGCAAALANLELYKRKDLISKINRNANYLAKRLKEFQSLAIVGDIRHKGLLAAIDLKWKGEALRRIKNRGIVSYYIAEECFKSGLFTRMLGNIVLVIPPLAIDRPNLEKILNVLLSTLEKIDRFIRAANA
jgi:adenosylmethionine-8-amino-7-oxononanoate aminotransferase